MFFPLGLRKTPFLQFRAGKMKYNNGIVSPDLRKGYLSFTREPGDVIGVIWTGSQAETEDTYSWKKNQVEVSFVEKCTTGRVLLFKVNSNGTEKLHFFWLQEKSDAKDAEHLAKLKEAFPGKTPVETNTPSVQLSDLKKIIASISNTNSTVDVSIPELVSSGKVADAVRSDPDFYKSRLQDTLPEELASSANILDHIRNPQVSHAAALLEAGLKNPLACKELCKMYGLPENSVGVSGFINAIIDQAKKSKEK